MATKENSKVFKIFEMELFPQGSEYASEVASKVKDASFLNQFKYRR